MVGFIYMCCIYSMNLLGKDKENKKLAFNLVVKKNPEYTFRSVRKYDQ